LDRQGAGNGLLWLPVGECRERPTGRWIVAAGGLPPPFGWRSGRGGGV